MQKPKCQIQKRLILTQEYVSKPRPPVTNRRASASTHRPPNPVVQQPPPATEATIGGVEIATAIVIVIAIEGETDGEAVWTEAAVTTVEAEVVVAAESVGNVGKETGEVIVASHDRDRAVDPENLLARVVGA